MVKTVLLIGSTGFMGRSLAEELLRHGHRVETLVRAGSESRAPKGTIVRTGDPLDHTTYLRYLNASHTIVQLVGVSHPNPFKKDQFQKIDFTAGRESVIAAKKVGCEQFVYVSVAQPAPIMKSYIDARAGVEKLIRENKLSGTILRPWYVLGPGRQWPRIMIPFYWILEKIPFTRNGALRLGFVTREQMIRALTRAIEIPTTGVRVWEVPEIRI